MGLRLTVWLKSLRVSRLGLRMFSLFPMTEEVLQRLFVSSVNLLITCKPSPLSIIEETSKIASFGLRKGCVEVDWFGNALGGPAVGDIRSRCLRLSDQSTAEALAVRRLLGHRLPLDAQQAKSEW